MIYLLIIVLILLVLFVWRQSSGYNIVKYEIDTDKDISPVSVVMISDLHDTDVTGDNNRGLIRSIDELAPDIVILAGDMVTSYKNPAGRSDKTLLFLKELASKYKVYYGLGNHEQRYKEDRDKYPGTYDELTKSITGYGITLLSDDHADLDDNNITIYGFNVPLGSYSRINPDKIEDEAINDALSVPDTSRFNILIAHNPDHFKYYVKWHPDLILAGHLHGGIVNIPGIGGLMSPQLKIFPKYDFGKFTEEGSTMIVSRGIGWHSIPIRIFNKAEIVHITIRNTATDN